jgi:arylsulfatase A-like enzyme
MDVSTSGADLAVAVGTDDAEQVVARVAASAAADWRTVDVDLTPWTGKLVRVTLRAEPTAAGPGERWCRVRRFQLDSSPGAEAIPRPTGPPPNVVLYVVDTVRADHLGCYGSARPATPRIDAFSRDAVLFGDAVAQSSWTLSATASILTGMTPRHHGAVGETFAIRPEVPTLAELLHAGGYTSAAFSTNYFVSADFGQARGFDRFRLYPERPGKRKGVYLPSSALFRRVRRWLAARPPEPFFLYVHATDPHWPYRPPRRYLRPFRAGTVDDPAIRRATDAAFPFFFGNVRWGERRWALPDDELAVLRDLYDAELRQSDDYFGRLLDLLAAAGRLENTVVVLTSDHGEEFQDHGGLAHGQTLYDEVLHVPLVVRLPHGAAGGTRVARTVQQVDIAPTVLALANLPVPGRLDGRSLLDPERPLGNEALSFLGLMGKALESLTRRDTKVVHAIEEGDDRPRAFEAYDRLRDRAERENLAATSAWLLAYARQRFDLLGLEAEAGPAIDPKQLERLRALGYVQD